MAEDRTCEKPGDGQKSKQMNQKVAGSDIRNGTRQPVNISPKDGAMSVSIARIDAHTKHSTPDVDGGVPIAVPFGRASTEAMTGIRRQLWRKLRFDNGIAGSRFPIVIESDSECSRQTAFLNARGTYGTKKLVDERRFLSCVSE
jgi:hypothetical protein